jgi:hypothetical protein
VERRTVPQALEVDFALVLVQEGADCMANLVEEVGGCSHQQD